MKKRNAKVFALFMSVAMAMPNVAAAMPVYAAPEADFGDKFEEEFEAEAEEEVEAEDTTDAEEFEKETEDIDAVQAVTKGDVPNYNASRHPVNGNVSYEIIGDTLKLTADGKDAYMADFAKGPDGRTTAPWHDASFTKVIVTGDLKNIGDCAFYGMTELKSVELENCIELIGASAFEDCKGLETVRFKSIDEISITEYGYASFKNCESLVEMDFSQNAEIINDFTFDGCVKYTNERVQELPGKLWYIGAAAFRNCKAIESLRIPYSVEIINGGYDGWSSDSAANDNSVDNKLGAFAGCTGLKTVTLVAANNKTANQNDMLKGVVVDKASMDATGDHATLKTGAQNPILGLYPWDFENQIVTSDLYDFNADHFDPAERDGSTRRGVYYIGDFAFYGCTALGSVDIPDTVVDLGNYSFSRCGLTAAAIQKTDDTIRSNVSAGWEVNLHGTFEYDSKLENVKLGSADEEGNIYSNIIQVGDRSFNACSSLKTINLEAASDAWRIGEEAFRGCSSLEHINMPAALVRIDDRAFRECSVLDDVVLPDESFVYEDDGVTVKKHYTGVLHVGKNAFYDCNGMTNIYIPYSLNYEAPNQATTDTIDEQAFASITGNKSMRLMDVYYGGSRIDNREGATVDDIMGMCATGNVLITADENATYKATRYPNSDVSLPTVENVTCTYVDGSIQIKWDAVKLDGKFDPDMYEVYVNHAKNNTLDEQWNTITPSWTQIGKPTSTTLTYKVDNAVPGDIYNFRIRPIFGGKGSRLSENEEYKIPSAEAESPITAIVADQQEYAVKIDRTVTVNVEITPSDADASVLKWVSEDPSIASVSVNPEDDLQGFITGVKEGETNVKIYVGDVETTFKVTVSDKAAVAVESVAMDKETLTVRVDSTGELNITVLPEDADPTNYKWESSNNQVATVVPTKDEKSAVVTGVKEGTATITVTSKNGHSATCEVTVGPKQEAPSGKNPRAIENADGTVSVYQDGKEVDNYTGLAMLGTEQDAPWVYVKDDKRDQTYTGFVDYDGATFYVSGGTMDTTAAGLKLDPVTDSWMFVGAGAVQKYTGLAEYDGEWFYVEDGKLDTKLNAFVPYDGGLFAVGAGRIIREYSGLMQDPQNTKTGDWYYFALGEAQLQYTGLVEYDGAWFYVKNGQFDITFNGSVNWNGATFQIKDGQAIIQ